MDIIDKLNNQIAVISATLAYTEEMKKYADYGAYGQDLQRIITLRKQRSALIRRRDEHANNLKGD